VNSWWKFVLSECF